MASSLKSDEEEEVPPKRFKSDVLMQDVVSSEILARKDSIRQEYATNKPFPHAILPNLFDTDFIRKAFTEIKATSQVTFKESDLFRVYQSIDLANLSDKQHQDTLPTVLQLRQVLYSNDWRHFMEDLAGLERGTLSEQVDCACNCHTTGCHLLCHDDVIGTRRISYILYLTGNDWEATEGGALELYDSHIDPKLQARIPDTVPDKSILPLFNHMAFFVVEPGTSFHAVQEVLGERPRLSLQGWYHAAEAPDNLQNATLQRLKNDQENDTEIEFQPMNIEANQESTLSDQDREYLSQYLDATYLKPEAIAEIRDLFEKESSVQLQNFFKSTWMDKLSLDKEDSPRISVTDSNYYRQYVSESWKLVGPAHKQRFLEYQATSSEDESPTSVGEILAHLRQNVMESAPFARFLSILTSLGLPTGVRSHIRRFRPGLDYTVAHHGLLTETSVLDATVCFVVDKNEEPDEAAEAWESGDVGGFECYIEADDNDEDAADEYNQDEESELLSVSASNNTLSLVYRDPGTMRFVKYVGSSAPSSRWDIAMEYQVPEEEEDADDVDEAVDETSELNEEEGKSEGGD